ncbi:replicative DNA helicase, partial [Candidatus Parcubacteria bacterium]|nr:replicative DNA helicase [Candidatus Parcubacteria bacterium]
MATAPRNIPSPIRVPPQNIDSERALLGSIMLRPEALHEVIDAIDDQTFYSEKHRVIWRAMFDLYQKREPIDLLSLSSKLKERKELDAIGGRAYLTELVNLVPSSSNLTHYAEMVRRKYVLRKLIEAADHIAEMGFKEEQDIEVLLDDAEKRIFNITSGTSGKHKFVAMKYILGDAWERIDKLHKTVSS